MSYPTKGNGNSPKKECAKAKELHQERDLRLLEMNQQALVRKKQKNKQTCHQFNNKRECCVLCLAFPVSNKLAMQVRLLFFSHTPNSRSSPLAATRLQMRQFRYILYGSFGLRCSLASFFFNLPIIHPQAQDQRELRPNQQAGGPHTIPLPHPR